MSAIVLLRVSWYRWHTDGPLEFLWTIVNIALIEWDLARLTSMLETRPV